MKANKGISRSQAAELMLGEVGHRSQHGVHVHPGALQGVVAIEMPRHFGVGVL